MKQHLSRRYLIASLIAHGVVIIVVSWALSIYRPTQTFVVSASTPPALFMPLRSRKPITAIKNVQQARKKSVTTKKATVQAKKKPLRTQPPKPKTQKAQKPKQAVTIKKKTAVPPKKKATQIKKAPVKKPVFKKSVDHTTTTTRATSPLTPVKPVKKEPPRVNTPQHHHNTDAGSVILDTRRGEQAKGVQGEMATEITRVWHPPIGVPKETECTLTFVVDMSGEVSSVELVKPSPHMLYNLSVQRVPFDIRVPVQLRGKRIQITFKQ